MRPFAPIVLVVMLLIAAPAASADYGVVRQFGAPGSGPGQFNNPIGIGVGPDGHVFVADGVNDRVEEFLGDGTYVRSFGQSGTQRGDLRLPEDALSDGTSLFVTDCYNARVTQYALATGAFVNAWGHDQHSGDPAFACPEALAMSASGVLFVDDTFNGRVVSFDPGARTTFHTFGSVGTGPGQFTQAHGIQFDQDGNLLVGDDNPRTCTYARIERFTPAGAYLGLFGTFQAGTGAGQVFCVQDIDRDAAGNVFVSDAASRVYAFADDGTLVRQVDTRGELGFPIGLDSNARCELYAVDTNRARIVVFGWPDAPVCRLLTPAPLPVTLPHDATPPTVLASASKAVKLGAPLRFSVACPFEDCTVRVKAYALLHRAQPGTVLASLTKKLSAGRRVAVSLHLSRLATAVVRAHLRTHKKLVVTLRLTTTDAVGNRTIKSLPVAVRRASKARGALRTPVS